MAESNCFTQLSPKVSEEDSGGRPERRKYETFPRKIV